MVAEWILAIATVILALATIVLALATWNLFRATRQLEKIEERRDQEEAHRQRRERVARKLALGEEIIAWHPEKQWIYHSDGIAHLAGDLKEGTDVRIFREFALLVDRDDEVAKYPLEEYLSTLDRYQRGMEVTGVHAQNFVDNFVKLQEVILRDLPTWRAEILQS